MNESSQGLGPQEAGVGLMKPTINYDGLRKTGLGFRGLGFRVQKTLMRPHLAGGLPNPSVGSTASRLGRRPILNLQ